MRRIAICDDERVMLDRLEALARRTLEEKRQNCEVTLFQSPVQLARRYEEEDHPFDLVLLDIEMPELDGIALARRIRTADRRALLLFITSHEQFVYKGYEVEALRYIPKDEIDRSVPAALDAALEKLAEAGEDLLLQSRGADLRLAQQEILYIEKSGKNCVYYTVSGDSHPVRRSLASALEELSGARFVPVNSGSVVNMEYIKLLEKDGLQLVDGTRLPVSRLRVAAVKQSVHHFWSSEK